jgi:hypothetical protein
MVASWVSQASFEPPGITVAVAKDRAIEALMQVDDRFVLNVLREDNHQPCCAISCAVSPRGRPLRRRGHPRWRGGGRARAGGGPALAFLGCRVAQRMERLPTTGSSMPWWRRATWPTPRPAHRHPPPQGGQPLLMTTLFRPDDMVPGDGWGYFAFENGQHISFHSKRSFRSAMMRASIPAEYLFSFNAGLHVLAIRSPWQQIVRKAGEILRSRQAQAVVAALSQRYRTDPLTQPDHIHAMKLVRMNQPTANPAPDTSV